MKLSSGFYFVLYYFCPEHLVLRIRITENTLKKKKKDHKGSKHLFFVSVF